MNTIPSLKEFCMATITDVQMPESQLQATLPPLISRRIMQFAKNYKDPKFLLETGLAFRVKNLSLSEESYTLIPREQMDSFSSLQEIRYLVKSFDDSVSFLLTPYLVRANEDGTFTSMKIRIIAQRVLLGRRVDYPLLRYALRDVRRSSEILPQTSSVVDSIIENGSWSGPEDIFHFVIHLQNRSDKEIEMNWLRKLCENPLFDVNMVIDREGATMLHYFCGRFHSKYVQVLLQVPSINVTAPDQKGETALDVIEYCVKYDVERGMPVSPAAEEIRQMIKAHPSAL